MSTPSPVTNHKAPRHFHLGPDSNENEAISTPHLYKHALESIFAFLSLKDLGVVLTVCQSWSAAVKSMRPIDGSLVNSSISMSSICASPLVRHISSMAEVKVDSNGLMLLSLFASNLLTLDCSLTLARRCTVVFPSKLEDLALEINPEDENDEPVADLNPVMLAVSRLKSLRSFSLYHDGGNPTLSFQPLQRLPNLSNFSIDGTGSLTDAQVNEIRDLLHIVEMEFCWSAELLTRVLRRPHSLKWQSLGSYLIEVDSTLGALLPSLPSLTSLKIWKMLPACEPDFLARLPNLINLDVDLKDLPSLILDRWILSLQSCSQLADLTISNSDFANAHFNSILPRLTQLHRLVLAGMSKLESLQFLSGESIMRTLTHLALYRCNHPSLHLIELKYVHSLQSLTDLTISQSFVEPMDQLLQSLHKPPSKLIPTLTQFFYLRD